MINNSLRCGNFTSSEIVALTTKGKGKEEFGKSFYTYIQECNMERKMGASLETDQSAHALAWGSLIERYVFSEVLGTEYTLESNETIQHPEIECWVGSPDGRKFDEGNTVIDIKSPFTKKSFVQLVQPLYCGLSGIEAMNAIRNGFEFEGLKYDKHKDGEKFYWQLVSNSVLTKSKFAELIVFMPYQNQLEPIREFASNLDDVILQSKLYWLSQASDEALPHLPNESGFKNLNIIRFEVPIKDKAFLKSRVLKAKEMLIEI